MKTIQASMLALVLLAGSATAQTPSVFVLDMGNGKIAAMVTLADGQMVVVSNVTIFKARPLLPPVSLVASAYLIRETGDMDQQQADLEAQIRLRPSLSAKLKFLDPDMTDQDGNQPPLLKAIVAAVGTNLPQIVGVGSDGSVIASQPAPNSIDDVETILKGWGL